MMKWKKKVHCGKSELLHPQWLAFSRGKEGEGASRAVGKRDTHQDLPALQAYLPACIPFNPRASSSLSFPLEATEAPAQRHSKGLLPSIFTTTFPHVVGKKKKKIQKHSVCVCISQTCTFIIICSNKPSCNNCNYTQLQLCSRNYSFQRTFLFS